MNTEESYYLTEREKKLSKLINNKVPLKNYHGVACNALRCLIFATLFLRDYFFSPKGRVIQLNHVLEQIVSYLTLSEIGQLAVAMREYGCPNFMIFLRECCSSRVLKNCVLLNSFPCSESSLFFEYQVMQIFHEGIEMAVFGDQRECSVRVEGLLENSELNLLNLSRQLIPYRTLEKFDVFRMTEFSIKEYTNSDDNSIVFNPVYEIAAYISDSFTWVFSYAGVSRENTGQIVYRFYKNQNTTHLNASWSRDGLHLLLAISNKRAPFPVGQIIVFRYRPVAGIMRILQVLPEIYFNMRLCSYKLWCDYNAFTLISPDGQLIRYTLKERTIEKTVLFKDFESSINGPEFYSSVYHPEKSSFGCLTCSPFAQNVIAFLKPCQNPTKHRHDVLVLLRVYPERLLPLVYLSPPGFILEFEFYSGKNELWILWKENLNELWTCCDFNKIKISLPGVCPFSANNPWVSSSGRDEALDYRLKQKSKIAAGHYSLEENCFYPLVSMHSVPLKTLNLTPAEFKNYNYSCGNFWRKAQQTSFSFGIMQITDHFVGMILRADDGLFINCRVSF